MGLFAHWICARDGADALRDAGFGEIVEAETPGWLLRHPESGAQLPEWQELDEVVAARRAHAQGQWREVPKEIPRNPLETVRWVLAQ